MMKSKSLQSAAFAILGLLLIPTISAGQTDSSTSAGATSGESLRAATVLTIHGKVSAVDKGKKLVTIQVANGGAYTLKVDNPYNLDAATVGTGVVVHYYDQISVRKKKPGESLPSLSVNGGVTTAKPGAAPGAVAEEHLTAVVSVVQADKANGTVTIKGSDGSVETAKVNDPKILSRLKAGDDLVITRSRATAISLEKEPNS